MTEEQFEEIQKSFEVLTNTIFYFQMMIAVIGVFYIWQTT